MYGIRVSFREKIHANIVIFLYVKKKRNNLHKKAPLFSEAYLLCYDVKAYFSFRAFTSSYILSCTYIDFKIFLTSSLGCASYTCFT